MEAKKQKRLGMLYTLVVSIALFLLLWIGVFRETELSTSEFAQGYREWNGLECVVTEDENAPAGVKKIYTGIPDVGEKDECIAFYVVHQYVEVYFGEELQYAYMPAEGYNIGKTLGCNWIMVNLSEWEEGEEIRIEVTPVYKSFIDREIHFQIGLRMEIIADVLAGDFIQIFVSALAIITGIIFSMIAVYSHIKNRHGLGLGTLGLFSISVGLWRITDTYSSPLIFAPNTKLLFYISILSLMVGTIPVIKYVYSRLYGSYTRIITASYLLYFVITFSQLFLQVTNLVDLREGLWLTHILIFIEALTSVSLLIYDELKYRKQKKTKRGIGLFMICVIGTALDIIAYYVKGNSSGLMFTLVAFVIYVISIGVCNILEFVHNEQKRKEQEAQMAKNRIAIMISQIQPHFLYNTLNSIYYLCEKEPAKAQQAIDRFATYLRGNLDALKSEKLIPFAKELEHVEIYLSLEKMRFEDALEIEYDIRVRDFNLPALSIQPLVENAVKYGVGKKENGGRVLITANEEKDGYQIIIEDDGVGFDPDEQSSDGRSHIGIKNVKQRLADMCSATLEVSSKKGVGTRVKIVIPKETV